MRIARRVAVVSALLMEWTLSAAVAADSKNIEGTPQAKAYRALLKAIDAGDYDGMKKCMTKESAAGIENQTREMNLDVKKGMELMKVMTPKDQKLTSLKVEGKKATLEATGSFGKEVNKGTVALEQEDGQWKVVNQSWTSTR